MPKQLAASVAETQSPLTLIPGQGELAALARRLRILADGAGDLQALPGCTRWDDSEYLYAESNLDLQVGEIDISFHDSHVFIRVSKPSA